MDAACSALAAGTGIALGNGLSMPIRVAITLASMSRNVNFKRRLASVSTVDISIFFLCLLLIPLEAGGEQKGRG